MGIEQRRHRDRQRRIGEIITAAKAIFLSKGFSGTTMNDIADTSELSRRTIYHYFRSKEEVSLAAAADTLSRLLAQVEEIHGRGKTGVERLELTFDMYRRMFQTDPGGFQFIVNFSDSLRSMGTDNELVRECFAHIDRIVSLVAAFLREGAEDGSVKPLADPERTAAAVVSLVHGAVQNAVSDTDVVRLATRRTSDEFLQETFEVFNSYLRV